MFRKLDAQGIHSGGCLVFWNLDIGDVSPAELEQSYYDSTRGHDDPVAKSISLIRFGLSPTSTVFDCAPDGLSSLQNSTSTPDVETLQPSCKVATNQLTGDL